MSSIMLVAGAEPPHTARRVGRFSSAFYFHELPGLPTNQQAAILVLQRWTVSRLEAPCFRGASLCLSDSWDSNRTPAGPSFARVATAGTGRQMPQARIDLVRLFQDEQVAGIGDDDQAGIGDSLTENLAVQHRG